MEKFSSVISLSFLVLFLLVCNVNSSTDNRMSSEWVEYTRDINENVFLYNKVKIKHRTKDIVQVWDGYFLSDKSRKEYIQLLIKSGVDTKGYDKLSHRFSLSEIDCKKKMFRELSLTEYDKDSNVLNDSHDKSDWEDIIPNTTMDELRKKVCK